MRQGRLNSALPLFGLIVCVVLVLLWQHQHRTPLAAEPVRCAGQARPALVAAGAEQTKHLSHETLLYDDFSTVSDNMQVRDGTAVRYAIEGGAYLMSIKKPALLAWSLLDQSYGNVAVQVEAILVDGAPSTTSSLLFRYQDDSSFYLFNVSGNGLYNLELLQRGSRTVLIDWTPSHAIEPIPASNNPLGVQGRKRLQVRNTLRVELAGERISLFVNGTRLDETLDDTFQQGKIGLAVKTFEDDPATVCFDNLLIAAIGDK